MKVRCGRPELPLPGYNIAGIVRVSPANYSVTLAVNYGGSGDWTQAEVDTLRANATFYNPYNSTYLGFDTTNAPGGATYGSSIIGTYGISKLGANSLTLSGSNNYSGGTKVSEGTLILGRNECLGVGAIDVWSGTLDLGGYSQATSSGIHIYGGVVQNGTLKSSGGNFGIEGGMISAVLANGTSSCGLYKSSTGTAILSGSNTYTGATTVSEGTLIVANAIGSATGSGAVTVNSGATLSGSGIIAGPVTVAGILALETVPEFLPLTIG